MSALASLFILWQYGRSDVLLSGKFSTWFDKVPTTPQPPANASASDKGAGEDMEQVHVQPQQTSNETIRHHQFEQKNRMPTAAQQTTTTSQQSQPAGGAHESSPPVLANLATANSTADCSIDAYHIFYDHHFEQPMTFFSVDCLKELMAHHPNDISLRVGFFRLKHECQRRRLKQDPQESTMVLLAADELCSRPIPKRLQ